jgi:hypothetical protein
VERVEPEAVALILGRPLLWVRTVLAQALL